MENILADTILILHFTWILFIILALPAALLLKLARLRVIHTIALIFTVIMQATKTLCPLTIIEEHLRRMGSATFSYDGSFIITWLRKLIYIEDLGISLLVVYILTAIFLIFTFTSYLIWPISLDRKKPSDISKSP
jgi:Protein of Unknown function (DUF2784)